MAYKPITDQQVRLYMSDLQNHSQRTSAARAGFSERNAPYAVFRAERTEAQRLSQPVQGLDRLLQALVRSSTIP